MAVSAAVLVAVAGKDAVSRMSASSNGNHRFSLFFCFIKFPLFRRLTSKVPSQPPLASKHPVW